MHDLLIQLRRPFAPAEISWLPGAVKDGKTRAMAYADVRAYQDRLDDVCGLDWSSKYLPWLDGRIICELTIAGVTRSSTGEMNEQDVRNGLGGTAAEAQALKRAASAFGLGRYLYQFPATWVEYDAQRKRITQAGLAELDRKYRQWYAQAVKIPAQAPEPSGPRQVDPATGEIVESAAGPETDDAPTADAAAAGALHADQVSRLNELGLAYYGTQPQWEAKQPELVAAVSTGSVRRVHQLAPTEADRLIAGLEKRLAARTAKLAAAGR